MPQSSPPDRGPQGQREQYEQLLAELAAGTHTLHDRGVLEWDIFAGDGARVGMLIVVVQYGGAGGDRSRGGLLYEYVFDPAELDDAGN
jgi:hypothetical protein